MYIADEHNKCNQSLRKSFENINYELREMRGVYTLSEKRRRWYKQNRRCKQDNSVKLDIKLLASHWDSFRMCCSNERHKNNYDDKGMNFEC